MVRSRGHMRTHYIARWSKNTHSNLRKIASRVAVAVREDTTYLTGEPMPQTLSTIPASRTGLRGIRRIHVADGNAGGLRFVFDKGLQLPPAPAMQARSQAFAHSNPIADVREVLQRNRSAAGVYGLGNDSSADLVVDVPHVTRLAAGDSGQQLLCRLGAVALKSRAQRQKTIARVSEFSTSVKCAVTCGGQDIFTQVDAQDVGLSRSVRPGYVQNDVQIPNASLLKHLGFPDAAAFEIGALKLAESHLDLLAAIHRKKRKIGAAKVEGARIDVDRRGCTKLHDRPLAPAGAMRLQATGDGGNRVADHLRSETGEPFADGVVREVMQANTICATVLEGGRRNRVAGGNESRSQGDHLRRLLTRWRESNRNRAFHEYNATRQVCHTPGTLQERRFLPGLNAEVSASTIR